MNSNLARKQFIEWTRRNYPGVYAQLVKATAERHNLRGLGDIWETISETAQKVLPVLVQAKAQRDIFNAQLKRAEKGLPPLETSQIAPTLKVEADIGQETRQELIKSTGEGFKKYLLPIGIGLGFLVVGMYLTRKKRR